MTDRRQLENSLRSASETFTGEDAKRTVKGQFKLDTI